MMTRLKIVPFLVLVFFNAAPAVAIGAEAENLYEAEVLVTGQGSEERVEPLKSALAEVVVKVTGERNAVDDPQLAPMFARADEFVEQYLYQPLPEETLDGLEDSLAPLFTHVMQVRFDPKAINRTLREAGLPVWSRVRPLTLAWVAVQEEGRKRYIIGVDTSSEWRKPITDSATRRGIPLLLPALDLEDQQNVSFADVWADFQTNLFDASRRYQADALLVGRIQKSAGAEWQASWSFHQGKNSDHWQATGATKSVVLAAGVDNAADLLAARFAKVFGQAENGVLRIRINDVNELGDYARVLRYLESLDAVVAVSLTRVEPRSLVFDLTIQSSRDGLRQMIALGNTLTTEDSPSISSSPVGDGPNPVAQEELNYRLLP